MRELETNPPALGFGTRDPRPTVGAVRSGERRSGTGGLGGWAGGLDSPNINSKRNFSRQLFFFLFFFFSYFSHLLWGQVIT